MSTASSSCRRRSRLFDDGDGDDHAVGEHAARPVGGAVHGDDVVAERFVAEIDGDRERRGPAVRDDGRGRRRVGTLVSRIDGCGDRWRRIDAVGERTARRGDGSCGPCRHRRRSRDGAEHGDAYQSVQDRRPSGRLDGGGSVRSSSRESTGGCESVGLGSDRGDDPDPDCDEQQRCDSHDGVG